MPNQKPCPDCGKLVSTRAAICPNCGRRKPHRNPVIDKAMGIGFLVLVVVMGLCIMFTMMQG
jgi:hypothetical protein